MRDKCARLNEGAVVTRVKKMVTRAALLLVLTGLLLLALATPAIAARL